MSPLLVFIATVLFLASVLGLIIYTLVLGILGIVRRARRRRNPESAVPVEPIWKRKAGIPLLLWPVVIVVVVPFMIPNLIDAIHRTRAVRAMNELRRIGTAVEQYAIDHKAYPAAQTVDELARILEPEYIKSFPRKDGWGNSYRYSVRNIQKDGPQEYIIICLGRDGLAEAEDPWSYPKGPTEDYRNDIVFSMDAFIRYPEGRCC